MRPYQELDEPALIKMLSQQVERLTQLLSERQYNVEYENCKKIIEQLTDEISHRKYNSN